VRALGGNMQGWRKDPKNNPPRLRLEFYEFDGKDFTDITEEPAMSDEDGAVVSAKKSRNAQKSGALDFSGSLPGSIRTVALVMPASIQSKDRFDSGKAALEAAGYKVKVMPRLDFEKVAPVADRVADFEQAWMDPEVDLVLCARGGRGAEDLLDKIDWAKLRTRNQRVLGFSNITMLRNAMLKEQAGRPYSGPTLSQFVYAKRPTFDWLSKALADNAPMPDVKLRVLRPGACSGLACGGHITLVLKGVEMGWAADAKDRIVFLETSIREPAVTRAELDRLVASGYFKDCAGVVFGDMAAGGPNRTRLSGKALAAGMAEMARIRRDFADKMTCPVYEDYPYGHVSISYAIDFLRKKTITADGILKQ
jgi:muramoyltetrapeptide carboxypeptidase